MSLPANKLSQSILAFDYGTKRVGVAHKPAGSQQITVVTTLAQDDQFWPSLRALLRRFGPDQLVIGWPRNSDADITAQTALAEQFAKEVAQRTQLPVQLVDEFDSTQRAQKLLPKGLSVRRAREMIDQYAAQVILQDYLEENS